MKRATNPPCKHRSRAVGGSTGRFEQAATTLLEGLVHYRRSGAPALTWDTCMASIGVLIGLGMPRPAALAVGRMRGQRIATDWQDFSMSPADLQRMADAVEPHELEQWVEEGSQLPLGTIIHEITEALTLAATSNEGQA